MRAIHVQRSHPEPNFTVIHHCLLYFFDNIIESTGAIPSPVQINVKILAARNSPAYFLTVLTTLTGKEQALDCAIGASIDLPIQ